MAEWNALYDVYNEVACLMLGSMTPKLHRQFENCSLYEMLQELRSMFENNLSGEMKGYADQLERLGYMLPQDIIVGIILNGLTKDFVGFVRNYKMHNMRNTIGELHAMLIEYENGLPKKAKTIQVMMIKGVKIQKAKKKLLKTKGKGKANGNGNDKQVYIPKHKNPKPYAKEHPSKDDACHQCKEVGHWKRNCLIYLAELLKKKKQVGSAIVTRYAEFFEKNIITQKVSGRAIDLEEIQNEDASPSEITTEIPMEVEGFKPPQEEVIPVRRSKRTHQAPDGLLDWKSSKQSTTAMFATEAEYIAASEAAMEVV
nr:hypothetical protein [Tanacetum cinerariifolium]